MPDNLIQKKNESTWYVVKQIPKDVRRALGNRTTFTKSLKTGLRSEAMKLRLCWLAKWEADIAAARAAKGNKGDEWRLAQHEIGKDLQQRRTNAVTKIFTPLNPDAAPADISWFEKLPEIVRELRDEGQNEIADRLTRLARKYLDVLENGINAGEGINLQNEFLMIIGDIEAASIAEEYDLSDNEHQEAQAIVVNPALYKPRSPISPFMIEAWSKHLVSQIASAKTRDSHKARVEKISKFLTTEGAPLTFDTIHKFLNRQSGARQTLTNYLWSGRDFWKWAMKYNSQFHDQFSGQQCPFDGHDLPKVGKKAGESYTPFTVKEVEDLHKKAKEGGKNDLANLIVFGAFTGARLEEIGRIKSDDTIVNSINEPIGFKINESKTDAGVREVPLHPSLVPLYKHLRSQASANDGYLFKGGNNKYGNRLDWLGKQFGQLKTRANFSNLHVFHSIRKTATTELHRAGVGIEVIPYIMGHENPSFTFNVYSAGCSFEQKKEAIRQLTFNFK
ncbi:tyrosine-type recombinase/integrase [Pseudomonas sp. KK4]|uniref:tyrosine-type recombinase/integrase n=1 Tax=Pseudomonas sp. KK4 TaxID=1855729 RepID=UPI00097C6BB8|nr:tyrosine-type recombinase/integrase [Pseudomonas sp. KK4]